MKKGREENKGEKEQKIKWCSLEKEEVVEELDSDANSGLSRKEEQERLKKHGYNKFKKGKEVTLLGKTFKQLKDPLIVILFLAGIATLFLQHYVDTIVIFVALILNIIIGIFQEEKASKAFEKLSESQEKYATTLKDGEKKVIPAKELVLGDIVIIEAGSYVPADMYLLTANNLSINESALTGEWEEVHKKVGTCPGNSSITEMHNMAWMATLVVGGSGKGIVAETGQDTQVGKIAEDLTNIEETKTPLQKNVARIAKFLIYLIAIAIVFIFAIGLWKGQPLVEMMLIGIAIAVAAMPQGLPAAVTATLAVGMRQMLKRGGLVRNLRAAETLGSTSIILTDKTGTLTEAKMSLLKIVTLNTLSSPEKEEGDKWEEDEKQAIKQAVKVSDAFIEKKEGKEVVRGEPMEKAMVNKLTSLGFSFEKIKEENTQLNFLPFRSQRGFTASLHKKEEGGNIMYVNGIPEKLIEMSDKIYQDGEEKEFTEETKQKMLDARSVENNRGMRTIASGYVHTERDQIDTSGEDLKEEGLIFAGLFVFEDPVREDVPPAVHKSQETGALVVMITGDNSATAKKVAKEVGIIDANMEMEPITGKQIDELTDEELYSHIKNTKVFSRVLPHQKLRISKVLKSRSEVVAMTGDGVNDAPALRSADIGISVGVGTEVAKEASDLILINNSFAIIVKAIEQGRKIVDNLKKIVSYLLSTSFTEIITIGGALAAALPTPLLPTQILWANIVEEGFMSFAFVFERKEEDIMKRDPRSPRVKNVLTIQLKKMIALVTTVAGFFLFGIYLFTTWLGLPIEEIRTIMFVALSIDSIFFALSLKDLDKPAWRINFLDNKYLLASLSLSIILVIVAITVPPIMTLLSVVPLTWLEIGLLMLAGIFDLFIIEMAKYFIFIRKSNK